MAYYKKKSDTDPSSPNKAISPQYQNSSPGTSWPPAPPDTGTRSQLPGESDMNPFRKLHPKILRPMYDNTTDPEKKFLIWKALKQWSRQFTESLIQPFKFEKYFADIAKDYSREHNAKIADAILKRAMESVYPAANLFYYQDGETTQFPDEEHGNMVNYHGDPEIQTEKMYVYPRDFDQGGTQDHLQQNIDTDIGDFQTPTEDPLVEDLRVNRGDPQDRDKSYPQGNGSDTDNGRTGGVQVSQFFDNFVWASDDCLDLMFKSKKASVKKVSKIVKLADLNQFMKVGNDLLIHKSKQDLWAMEEDEEGNLVISRLFDGDLI